MIIALTIGLVAGFGSALSLGAAYPAITAKLAASHEVSSITASLTKMRDKLLDAVEHHTAKADAHTTDAFVSQAQASVATDMASSAAAAADKLSAILP